MIRVLLLVVLTACLTLLAESQQTGVSCSPVTPIDVPRDPSLYWGTWYTIATCSNCSNPSNVCSQVGYEPLDSTNLATNVTYIGSFQSNEPDGPLSQAFGVMSPIDLESFDPLYRFDLDLGFAVIPSKFWVLTTAGDGSDISAIVTMSCGLEDNGDQQLFFLSRKPYFVPPVTFDSLSSQVRRAITNYDAFDIVSVTQQQGWCEYALTEDASPSSICDCGNDDDNELDATLVFATLSAIFSLCVLAYIIFAAWCKKTKSSSNLKSDLI